jgi:hypothetical protein
MKYRCAQEDDMTKKAQFTIVEIAKTGTFFAASAAIAPRRRPATSSID